MLENYQINLNWIYNEQVYEPCLFGTIELTTALISMAHTPCYKLIKLWLSKKYSYT